MIDNSGVIQAQYAFDPYGRVTKISESVASDFGYAGYYLHSRSGFNLTMFREYSSGLGRWLTRDPIEGRTRLNDYAYVGNSPVVDFDPLLLLSFWDIQNLVNNNNNSGLSNEFLICQLWQESSFNQNAGQSTPYKGLGQVSNIATQEINRVNKSSYSYSNVKSDPGTNIAVGSAYLNLMIQNNNNNIAQALQSYGTGSNMYDKIKACESCLQKQLKIYGPPNIKCCLDKLHIGF